MLKDPQEDGKEVKKAKYEQNGNMNKEIGNLKRNQKEILELKSTVTKMKHSLPRFKGRLEQAEESANMRKGQWKLSRLRNRKKKD